MSIYSAEGLKILAKLLDDQIEDQGLYSQNELATIASVSPNTIRAIRGNRNLTEADWRANRHYEPGLEAVLGLAKGMIDPLTGQVFGTEGHPCRLERIVRGWEALKPSGAKKPLRSELKNIPNAKAVALLLQTAQRNPELFDRHRLPLDGEEFKSLSAGNPPNAGMVGRLLRILGIDFDDLAALYNITPDESIKPPKREKNGCAGH